MQSQTWIWIGAIGGSLIGVLGGLIGCYFSIKNTQGPRERAFMIQCSVICLAAVTLFLALLWIIPVPYRTLLWIPYPFLLVYGIRACNRTQERIRLKEANPVPPGAPHVDQP